MGEQCDGGIMYQAKIAPDLSSVLSHHEVLDSTWIKLDMVVKSNTFEIVILKAYIVSLSLSVTKIQSTIHK